jgi:hypothetical protein
MTDKDEVLLNVERAKRYTEPWHKNIIRWRKKYNFDHYATDPKPGEDRYTDPTLTNAVDLAVGILQSNDMVWHATGFQPSSKENKKSSIIEKTLAGIRDINAERKEIDMDFEVNLNFVRDGGACLYSIWDKEIHDRCFTMEMGMGDSEESMLGESKVYYELPLTIEPVDPLHIYLLPGGQKRWLVIARIEQTSAYDVEHLYGVSLKSYSSRTDNEKIDIKDDLVDYWDVKWMTKEDAEYREDMTDLEKSMHTSKILAVRNAVLFGNDEIIPIHVMEGYDDLPYTVGFYNPSSRADTSMWQSILSPQESSVAELEKAINLRKGQMVFYSNLPLIIRTQTGKNVDIDPGIGKSIGMKTGEDAGFPQWAGNPPDFDRHIDLIRSRIQQSGFSDVMYGSSPSGISGYALSQLGDQNRIRLLPAISHLERMWTNAARKWISLASYFMDDAYVQIYGHMAGSDFAEMLKGSDLSGYKVRCEIKPEFPNERVRNHAMATQAAPWLSSRRIMEDYLGIQQSDDERKQKLIEELETHPIAQQYAMILELKDIINDVESTSSEVETAQVVLKLLEEQLRGVGGRPKEPSNPEQPIGIQSSDGEALPTNQRQPQDVVQAVNSMLGSNVQMTGEVK